MHALTGHSGSNPQAPALRDSGSEGRDVYEDSQCGRDSKNQEREQVVVGQT